MKADLTKINDLLERSAELSKSFLSLVDDLRRQLDEQKKRSPMDIARDTFEAQKEQLKYRTEVEAIQKKRMEKCKEGTCRWIFENAQYKLWRDSPKSDLLFIHAEPNMGKSILVSSIINALQKECAEQKNVVTIYFFCSNGDDDAQKTDRIFQQTLYALYKLVPADLGPMDKCNQIVKRFLAKSGSQETNKRHKDKEEERSMPFDEAFKEVAENFKKKVFLVIDALDECVDRELRRIIKKNRRLVSQFEADGPLGKDRSARDDCTEGRWKVRLCRARTGDV